MYLKRRLPAMLALLVGTGAFAHDADVVFVRPAADPNGGIRESITLTAATLGQLAPVDADGDGALSQADLDARAPAIAAGVWDQVPLASAARDCARSGEQALLRDGFVELAARFQCGDGELWQDFRILRVLPANYRVEVGAAIAQGNVQRLVIRPATSSAPSLGFEAGLAAPVLWFEATLLLMLALLLAPDLAGAVNRWGVVVLGHAVVSLSVGLLGVWVPMWAAVAVMLAGGAAYAMGVLMRGAERAALLTLAIAAVGDGLRGGEGRSLQFQAGRAAAYLALALVLVPVARMVGRRPVLKRRAVISLACAALGALGFSLVQSVPGF